MSQVIPAIANDIVTVTNYSRKSLIGCEDVLAEAIEVAIDEYTDDLLQNADQETIDRVNATTFEVDFDMDIVETDDGSGYVILPIRGNDPMDDGYITLEGYREVDGY